LQVGRWVSNKSAVAAAYKYYGIYTHSCHIAKIFIPLLFAPVLVGYIVAYFVEKSAGNR
jgi:hypothetical protein